MKQPRPTRSGYVTVLVLVAIAIVAGLSYTMLHSSKTMVTVERNLHQRDDAKAAAQSGIEHALGQMKLSTWAGPTSNYSYALDSNSGFEVTYEYESRLVESDADYWQQPYRVLVTATGYSKLSGRTTRYVIQAETMLSDVRLNPSKAGFAISTPPRTVTAVDRSVLSALLPPNMGFWNRIDGTTHTVRGFSLWSTVESSYRSSFLTEMTDPAWQFAAPFTGRCDVEDATINSTFADAVSILVLELFQLPQIANGSKYTPAGATYQLYRGGPVYTIPVFSGEQKDTSWGPDATNPLGIYRGIASSQFGKDLEFSGTLSMDYATALTVQKKGVVFQRLTHQLPDGSQFELPVMMAPTISIETEEDISITGTIIADSSFLHTPQTKNAQCQITGKIYTDYFSLTTFDATNNTTANHSPADLADYANDCDLPPLPYCQITDLQPTNLHWQSTDLPFLIPNSFATDGYKWSLLSINEVGFQ